MSGDGIFRGWDPGKVVTGPPFDAPPTITLEGLRRVKADMDRLSDDTIREIWTTKKWPSRYMAIVPQQQWDPFTGRVRRWKILAVGSYWLNQLPKMVDQKLRPIYTDIPIRDLDKQIAK